MTISCRGVTGELDKLSRELKDVRTLVDGVECWELLWRYSVDLYDNARQITYHMEDVSENEMNFIPAPWD